MTRAFRQQPSPALAAEAARRITMSLSPNERLQHVLHPWTSFVIVPLFALANAGIDLSGDVFGRLFARRWPSASSPGWSWGRRWTSRPVLGWPPGRSWAVCPCRWAGRRSSPPRRSRGSASPSPC
ncbi:MAG: Na+/H+ antiporter NhaA [Chloroflexi bacterium]|nr:Na+/H+ antiporter NhaA [Chloroflexota bacterium]